MAGSATPEQLLRPGLLAGRSVVVAGPEPGGAVAVAVGSACAALGASVSDLVPGAGEDAAVALADVLVVDGAALFAGGVGGDADGHDADGVGALRACLDGAWNATRAVANAAFIAGGRRGRVLLVAPAPGAGPRARAAAAALENMARTLSVEWARHAITVVAIVPGDETPGEHVGALVAFLASPAGDYYSGCLLDLRGV